MDVFISTLCFLLKEIPTKVEETQRVWSVSQALFCKKFTHLHHKKYHLNKNGCTCKLLQI